MNWSQAPSKTAFQRAATNEPIRRRMPRPLLDAGGRDYNREIDLARKKAARGVLASICQDIRWRRT